jgi:ADP-L-glycero-D-manno-heptose 6-epimerase
MPLSKEGQTLVTGGAGFIGSALVWALNQRGYEKILVTDVLGSDEKWRNLVPLRFGDYVDAAELMERLEKSADAFGKVSTVFHLGACSATTERDAAYLMRNNFDYTRKLAHWCAERRIRFVYASSAATYGDGAHGMDDQDPDIDKLRPLNMYGYSKHLFDCYANRKGILRSFVGLKYFNVFGPNENHKGDMRSLVNKAFEQICETGRVRLFKSYRSDFADGEQMRDFLYVKDAVDMTIFLAERPLGGGLFNIGSGQAHSWVELATAIFSALGMELNIEFIEMPEELRDKYQYFTQANTTKLTSAGYSGAVTPLEDAVADYVRNYLVPDRRLGDESPIDPTGAATDYG